MLFLLPTPWMIARRFFMASGLQCRPGGFPCLLTLLLPYIIHRSEYQYIYCKSSCVLGPASQRLQMTQWALKKFKASVRTKELWDWSLTFHLVRRIISSGMWNANVTLNDIMCGRLLEFGVWTPKGITGILNQTNSHRNWLKTLSHLIVLKILNPRYWIHIILCIALFFFLLKNISWKTSKITIKW